MKVKLIFILCLLFFILPDGRSQSYSTRLPTQWRQFSKSVSEGDTLITAVKNSALFRAEPNLLLYKGVPNQMLFLTRPKKSIKIVFNKGIVKQLNDSIYEVIPKVLGDYEMKINGWRSTGRIETLPNPEIYLKGFPYPQPFNEMSVRNGAITIDNLIHHNKIEGRFKDYTYKVKEFQCKILGGRGESDIMSPIFKSDSIDSDFLKSLKIDHTPLGIAIINLELIAPDSTVRKIDGLFFATIYKDSIDMLMGRYLTSKVGPEKTVKSDVRIGIEGNPSQSDIQTIQSIIKELNSLITTVKVKYVKHFPSVVIRFDTTDAVHGKGAKTGTTRKKGENRFFPLLWNTRIFINTKLTNQERDLILWKEISRSLCEFRATDNYIISSIIGENKTSGLTYEDKMALKAIFSPGSDKIIKEIKGISAIIPNIHIVLAILLSIILFLIFYEVNNYFNFTGNIGNSLIKQGISGLFIVQLALGSLIGISILIYPNSSTPFYFWRFIDSLIQIELYACSLAIITSLIFHCENILSENFKAKWLRLALNPILTIISLYLAYQIIYLFVRGEFLRFMTIDINAITIGFSIVVVWFYMKYEQVKITSLMQEKEYELTRQKEMKNRAELNALQARINPHFLYNALNSIAALAHIDSKRTESMALSLSKLFRYSLNREEDMISTIGQEIEMTELYLEIEKQRFAERLDYSILVDEKLKTLVVPRLLIQPLVENSIKHGISKITGQGIIKLKVFEQGKDLIIEIYDNGPAFSEGLLSGYGLQNTYDKLTLVYKKPYEIKFINSPEKYVQIRLYKI